MASENGFCKPMSFSGGVTGKVNSARLLCSVLVIPELEKPSLGERHNQLGGSVISDRIKHKLSSD